MKYRVVTTIHAAGWEAYGRRMVISDLGARRSGRRRHLPLILYAEDFDPDTMPGLEVRRLPAWIDDFKAKSAARRPTTARRPGGYDYIFDAVKFAHKVAALTDAAAQLDDGVLIWLDADTFTHAPVETAWLDSLGLGPAISPGWIG
jgi:hypothetical protein